MVIGPEAVDRLACCRVAVFGIGGVGGYVVEGLARSGVGSLDITDADRVSLTNLNRQIIADHSTVGQLKVDAAERRILSINPSCRVCKHNIFVTPENMDSFDPGSFDFVVDAIDTVTAKLDIIERCCSAGVPVISAMGCGNRFDPSLLVVTDIYKTKTDPLAKVMRRELRKRGIRKLKVVYSEEEPIIPCDIGEEPEKKGSHAAPGSTPFVPACAGLIITSEVVKDLTGFDPAGRTKGGRQ